MFSEWYSSDNRIRHQNEREQKLLWDGGMIFIDFIYSINSDFSFVQNWLATILGSPEGDKRN